MIKEKVYFEEVHGKQVFCHFSQKSNSEGKKLVIMCHGFRGSSIGPARTFFDFQRLLNKRGYSVLRFDQPYSGNSDGDFMDVSFNEWVNTIVYFTNKYLLQGYEVVLLGQSMGGTSVVVATSKPELKGKIPSILLWVPGANADDFKGKPDQVFEEAGQKYKGRFWEEAKQADFFTCLSEYEGKIHLVYGEIDRFVSQESRNKVTEIVKSKNQPVKILKGQDHSPWEYDICQEVYGEEVGLLEIDKLS